MDRSKVSHICVVGEQLINDQLFIECVKSYDCTLITSVDGKQIQLEPLLNVLIIINDFECDLFKELCVCYQSIIGSTALLYNHRNKIPLSLVTRPVHNYSMKNLVICLAGFVDRDEADNLLRLLRFMGAASRKDLKSKVTHLVANRAAGAKYRTAVSTGVLVMSADWIHYCWSQRFNVDFSATEATVIANHKLKPFTGLGLCFINCDDTREMEELTVANGGVVVDINDEKCTHVVVDAIPGEAHPADLDVNLINKNLYVVYKEWFWASLEMAARGDETVNEHAYPISGTKNFKRSSTDYKLLSNSTGDLLSPALDFSRSFNASLIDGSAKIKPENNSTPKVKKGSKRYDVCLELLQTERNYVDVLQTITNVFRKPLEEPCYGEYLLDATEIRIIFGNLDPIHEVHKKILNDIQNLIDNWKETSSIGNIFVKHSPALLKAYPPFVNYFENSKETIIECDTKYPRFHAFLKKCQSKPECKRQSLTELLIRPIQRLPSVILLLTDILKNTEKSNSDYKQLSQAIERLKEVLMHINEDKRKTEGQIAMFDILNDIEDCPAHILSANRNFVCKFDVKLLVKNENNRIYPFKGYTITLFLFNDVLEICKKRSLKRSHSLTGKGNAKNNVPHSGGSVSRHSCKKSYRHIELLHLNNVKTIFHFSDCEESSSRTFCSYPFIADEKDLSLSDYLKRIASYVSENTGSEEKEIFQVVSQERLKSIDFEHADALANGLMKSNFSLVKTKEKISRALSIRRPPLSGAVSTTSLYTPPHVTERPSHSPSPRRISRAFSQLLNQIGTNSPLQRRQMSTTSLTELPDENTECTFSLPTTPAPRKKKCQSEEGSDYLANIN
ncbi:Protein ECT2-like protein [Dinothrombium tinctorium]|uniref:Protein ECT2-like protein n=1 Tax=Dinothrombium tinctorium TaxID=1965070 RepID=A0A3S3P4Y4_9ACAR|nr:Protein ECT2-like protein [Dinothrombium tinctorium]